MRRVSTFTRHIWTWPVSHLGFCGKGVHAYRQPVPRAADVTRSAQPHTGLPFIVIQVTCTHNVQAHTPGATRWEPGNSETFFYPFANTVGSM